MTACLAVMVRVMGFDLAESRRSWRIWCYLSVGVLLSGLLSAACARQGTPASTVSSHGVKTQVPNQEQVRFVELFNGRDLDGFKQIGGQALYTVEDGAIVGRSVPHTPNSFLTPVRPYADFVLEYDFMVHPKLNSGFSFAATAAPNTKTAGSTGIRRKSTQTPIKHVTGQPVSSMKDVVGGCFLEKRDEAHKTAFTQQGAALTKQNAWNHVRIEAIGNHIVTFLNGEKRADLLDAVDLSGFIGFQVHNVKEGEGNRWVKWRNIRLQDLGAHEFVPVTNGSLRGFQSVGADTGTGTGLWSMNGGVLTGMSDLGGRQSSLLSTDAYDDLCVRFEYRAPTGQSAFRVGPLAIDLSSETGTGDVSTSATSQVSQTSDRDVVQKRRKKNDWNELTVSVLGSRIVVQLNGYQVVDAKPTAHPLAGPYGFHVSEGGL